MFACAASALGVSMPADASPRFYARARLIDPSGRPLAAIVLEYDRKDDGLYAVGTLGGELFNEFFSKYEFRLALDHGGNARTVVESRCMVSELARYCRQQVKC